MKKWLLTAGALLLALSLAACTPGGTPSDTTSDAQEDNAPLVTLISDTVGADYQIVRTDENGNYALDQVRQIRDAIEAETGVSIPLKTDWYKDTAGNPPKAREILVGTTNREESVAATEGWRAASYLDWTVQLVGEKIVIQGGSQDAVAAATDFFVSTYIKDGTLSVPENLNKSYQHQWPFSSMIVAGHGVEEFQIVISSKANEAIVAAADKLQQYIIDNAGIELPIVKDSANGKVRDCEFLIGDTTREFTLSDTAAAATGSWDCFVDVVGTKVLFSADNVHMIPQAVNFFVNDAPGTLADGVYTLNSTVLKQTDNVIDAGIISTFRELTEDRITLGQKTHLKQLLGTISYEDLLDVDIYGRNAVVVLQSDRLDISADAIKQANRILRKACGFMTTDIPTSVKNGNGVKGECDFTAISLAQALYVDKERIEPETAEKLKEFFLTNNFQSQYYSENHMLIYRCARYLAASYFEDEYFPQWKKTGAELKKEDHDYLIYFLQHRAKQGWAEFDSMGYNVEDFSCLCAVYDYTDEEDLRSIIQMSLDSLLMSMIVDSTDNGIYGGAHGRNYDVVTTDLASRIYWNYYLYFGGESIFEVPVAMNGGPNNAIVSEYRPSDILYAIVADKTYPYTNYERIHNHTLNWEPKDFGSINKYTYNTELYSIGCVNRQDSIPNNTGNYEEHQQTNWSLTFAENSKASLTSHHPGNTGTHKYWNGDTNCFCNHLFGHENVVMGIYYIPGNAKEFNFIHAHIEKNEFDAIAEDTKNNRIFVRVGDAYAMIRFSAPYKWSDEDPSEVMIYDGDRKSNIRLAMVCEAGDKATYGSFNDFIAAMSKKEMVFDREELTLTYGNMKQDLNVITTKNIEENNYLDGVKQVYPYANTYDSPYMKSVWNSGVLEVYYRGYTYVMDFMNNTATMK